MINRCHRVQYYFTSRGPALTIAGWRWLQTKVAEEGRGTACPHPLSEYNNHYGLQIPYNIISDNSAIWKAGHNIILEHASELTCLAMNCWLTLDRYIIHILQHEWSCTGSRIKEVLWLVTEPPILIVVHVSCNTMKVYHVSCIACIL